MLCSQTPHESVVAHLFKMWERLFTIRLAAQHWQGRRFEDVAPKDQDPPDSHVGLRLTH